RECRAPTDEAAFHDKAGGSCNIVKFCLSIIPVQTRRLIQEMRFQQVDMAVEVVITNSTPPTPAALPPGTYLPYVPYSPPPRPRPAAPKPVPIDPLTAWYRKLAALRHDNAV